MEKLSGPKRNDHAVFKSSGGCAAADRWSQRNWWNELKRFVKSFFIAISTGDYGELIVINYIYQPITFINAARPKSS
jgi:hypothetical protein